MLDAFPPVMRRKHLYCSAQTLPTDATPTAFVFGTSVTLNLNDMFAPGGSTSSAHQPYARDTMATIYNRYKVVGVKLRVETGTVGGDTAALGFVGLCFGAPGANYNITGVTVQSASERPNTTVHSFCTYERVIYDQVVDLARLCGLSKKQFDADIEDYSAAVGSSPVKIPTMQVAVASAGVSNVNIPIKLMVEFDVQWFERVSTLIS